MEECVRSIHMDGLVWGASKLVPVGYGIKKLQIQCVVEDDKVGTDILEEEITKFEDYVSLAASCLMLGGAWPSGSFVTNAHLQILANLDF